MNNENPKKAAGFTAPGTMAFAPATAKMNVETIPKEEKKEKGRVRARSD